MVTTPSSEQYHVPPNNFLDETLNDPVLQDLQTVMDRTFEKQVAASQAQAEVQVEAQAQAQVEQVQHEKVNEVPDFSAIIEAQNREQEEMMRAQQAMYESKKINTLKQEIFDLHNDTSKQSLQPFEIQKNGASSDVVPLSIPEKPNSLPENEVVVSKTKNFVQRLKRAGSSFMGGAVPPAEQVTPQSVSESPVESLSKDEASFEVADVPAIETVTEIATEMPIVAEVSAESPIESVAETTDQTTPEEPSAVRTAEEKQAADRAQIIADRNREQQEMIEAQQRMHLQKRAPLGERVSTPEEIGATDTNSVVAATPDSSGMNEVVTTPDTVRSNDVGTSTVETDAVTFDAPAHRDSESLSAIPESPIEPTEENIETIPLAVSAVPELSTELPQDISLAEQTPLSISEIPELATELVEEQSSTQMQQTIAQQQQAQAQRGGNNQRGGQNTGQVNAQPRAAVSPQAPQQPQGPQPQQAPSLVYFTGTSSKEDGTLFVRPQNVERSTVEELQNFSINPATGEVLPLKKRFDVFKKRYHTFLKPFFDLQFENQTLPQKLEVLISALQNKSWDQLQISPAIVDPLTGDIQQKGVITMLERAATPTPAATPNQNTAPAPAPTPTPNPNTTASRAPGQSTSPASVNQPTALTGSPTQNPQQPQAPTATPVQGPQQRQQPQQQQGPAARVQNSEASPQQSSQEQVGSQPERRGGSALEVEQRALQQDAAFLRQVEVLVSSRLLDIKRLEKNAFVSEQARALFIAMEGAFKGNDTNVQLQALKALAEAVQRLNPSSGAK